MHRVIRSIAGAFAVGLLSTAAFADVTPDAGTIGTEFTATFEGDVGSKPKIELSFEEPGAKSPKAKAKVTSVNGGEVKFVIQAAKGGGSFLVRVKGSDEVAGSLTLASPRVDSADKATVEAGGKLTLSGQYFGEDANKRNAPKVFVNGKKAKSLSFTDGELEIQLHKSTPAGLADITVANKIGETTFNGQVTVTAPPKPIKGPDSLSARIDGKAFKVKFTKKTPEAAIAVLNVANNQLQITAAKVSGNPRSAVRTQTLNLIFILPTTLENLTLPATFNPIDSGVYQDGTTKLSIPPTSTAGTWTNAAGGNITLTITGRAGDRITGTFSGSLGKAGGDGPNSVSFENGEFTVTVQQ